VHRVIGVGWVRSRKKHEPYTGSPNSSRPKRSRQAKSKVKCMLIIFFHIKAIVPTYGNKPIVTLPKWTHYEYSGIRLG
jgi:hypothetical protein